MILDLNEDTVLLAMYALNPDGSNKTNVVSASVRVYYVDGGGDVDLLSSTSLSRVGSTNVWRYEWEPVSLPVGEYVAEYTSLDDDGVQIVASEDIVVRDMATQTSVGAVEAAVSIMASDVETIKAVETGRWKIENNQMVFYDDGGSPLLTFNLFDDSGAGSMENVFERVPV